MIYYNTTSETPQQVIDFEAKNLKQDTIILNIYFNAKRKLTPSDVLKRFPGEPPLTSIRRSITNLTNSGFLKKTEKKKLGMYGRSEHFWKLA